LSSRRVSSRGRWVATIIASGLSSS
jgi:hypothetical protein